MQKIIFKWDCCLIREKEESLVYFENIIESNNKFYSILALNNIIEKNLISDHEKIIGYFSLIEKTEK